MIKEWIFVKLSEKKQNLTIMFSLKGKYFMIFQKIKLNFRGLGTCLRMDSETDFFIFYISSNIFNDVFWLFLAVFWLFFGCFYFIFRFLDSSIISKNDFWCFYHL